MALRKKQAGGEAVGSGTQGTKLLGSRRWAIAEGYIPEGSTGPEPEMLSHETACVLNANDSEAHIRIPIYFSDREPLGPYLIDVGPRRTNGPWTLPSESADQNAVC